MTKQETTMLRVGVAAKRLGLHPMTVRRWLESGKIQAVQVGREARIPVSEVERLLGESSGNAVALYGRVSGGGQKEDLQRQLETLQAWAAVQRPDCETIVLSDIGSGLKADRRDLTKLLALAQEHRISEVAITYPDRLTRFGIEYLQAYFAAFGVTLTILNEVEDKSPEQELTEDLLAIITSFSGRLYGLRGNHKREGLIRCVKEVLASPDTEPQIPS